MDVVTHRSAGLDVHRSTIVACVLLTQADGRIGKERALRIPTKSPVYSGLKPPGIPG